MTHLWYEIVSSITRTLILICAIGIYAEIFRNDSDDESDDATEEEPPKGMYS